MVARLSNEEEAYELHHIRNVSSSHSDLVDGEFTVQGIVDTYLWKDGEWSHFETREDEEFHGDKNYEWWDVYLYERKNFALLNREL